MARSLAGDAEGTVAHAAQSLRLNPLDPMNFGMQALAGAGHFFAGRYADAIKCAETALHDRPNFLLAAGLAAAGHARLGRPAEAAAAMRRFRQINPSINLSNLAVWIPFQHSEQMALWRDSLREAGLPEGDGA
jgi:tetratricopeptide (TPR) repeat protein